MTTHSPTTAHLTDAEIQDIADGFDIYGAKPEFARAIESALLSKLRAPVADERAASFNAEDCNKEVYERGTYVGLFDIPKHVANELCAGISAATGARVDWHYFGGRVRLLALPAALASAPVAGEAQPSDVDILGLAGQYIQPRAPDAAPQIVNFARALLTRYAAPQASEAKLVFSQCLFHGPAPEGFADWFQWLEAPVKMGAFIRAATAADWKRTEDTRRAPKALDAQKDGGADAI